ncbi:MAG: ABC transporter permease [Candidatus Symbiobacter sp.]|nr:ABC transporter permease [Candidatus Symbiobacter sp.]
MLDNDPRFPPQNHDNVTEAHGYGTHFGAAPPPKTGKAVLVIENLHVYYGASHALQGISLVLPRGILAVVGRNGMGKTTLCQTILGLQAARSGRIAMFGRELLGESTHAITRLGVGYVPQGRRLWPSLTVDETLKLAASHKRRNTGGRMRQNIANESDDADWTIDRVYSVFPRLAERRRNGGSQLSGGEQQMLAIARALLGNPRLLVMDEPTEGLAPVIVDQVRDLLLQLAHQENVAILLIEQNIGVATGVSDQVAIMVNGRINRVIESKILAADRALQQRLLGVGTGSHEDDAQSETDPSPQAQNPSDAQTVSAHQIPRHFQLLRSDQGENFDPDYGRVNRWGVHFGTAPSSAPKEAQPAAAAKPREFSPAFLAQTHLDQAKIAWVVGTFDTKGTELFWLRDYLRGLGVAVRSLDLSTSGAPSRCDVTPMMVASHHPRGADAVFNGDRGAAVAAMAEAFTRWVRQQPEIGGMIAAGGSGGTFLASSGMRELPLGVPKIMVSTVASGDVAPYIGASDIMMMYAVADIQGINRITEMVLGNAAHAFAGMVARRSPPGRDKKSRPAYKPALGITMFGVTTPAVQHISRELAKDYDCLVFHATGTGGQAMENLADAGLLAAIIDLTTTEIADKMVGGVFPAHDDRLGAVIRRKIPYIGSVGALDMVNFGPRATVPEQFRQRLFVEHNPSVTLMRTTVEENRQFGEFLAERLNQMAGEVRFLLPELGISVLDQPGKAFYDPAADQALFAAIEQNFRATHKRRLIRVAANINDAEFVARLVAELRAVLPAS